MYPGASDTVRHPLSDIRYLRSTSHFLSSPKILPISPFYSERKASYYVGFILNTHRPASWLGHRI